MNVTEVQPQTANGQGIFSNAFSLAAANSAPFALIGGYYCLSAIATGSGSVTLKMLGPDGSTYVNTALTITTSATQSLGYLPQGTYKIVVTTFTAVYACVQSVPI